MKHCPFLSVVVRVDFYRKLDEVEIGGADDVDDVESLGVMSTVWPTSCSTIFIRGLRPVFPEVEIVFNKSFIVLWVIS